MGYEFEFVPVQPLFYMPHCPNYLYRMLSSYFDVMIGNSLEDMNGSRPNPSSICQQKCLHYDAFVDIGFQGTLLKENEERSLV